MKVRRVSFVTKKARAAGAAIGIKNWFYAIRHALITGAVLVMLIFGVNLIIRYVFESYDIKAAIGNISLSAKPKYFIITDEYNTVYTNGKTKIIEDVSDMSLPVLTGVKPVEDRPEYRKVLEQVLKIKPKYLENISEINLRNPEKIIMITLNAKKVYAGDGLSNAKMEKLHVALKHINKRYDYIDIRFKDRVIIK